MSNDGPWRPPFDRRPTEPPPFDPPAFERPPFDGPPADPRRVDRPAIERQRIDRRRVSSDEDPEGAYGPAPDQAYGPAPDRAYGPVPDRAYGRGSRSVASAERAQREGRRPRQREPEPERDGGPRRSRALVAVASLAALGVVAAVVVQQTSASEGGRGAGGQGWEAEQYGNSQMLAGDSERVCSVSADKLLFCLDPATGDEQFSHQFYDSIVTSPVLAGDRVLVASSRSGSSGALVAFSTDGTELWSVPVDISNDRRMPVVGDVVAIVSGDAPGGALVAIDVSTGAERWRAFTSADDGTQPHVVSTNAFTDGSRFYVAVAYEDPGSDVGVSGQIMAIDPGSGEELWRSPVLPTITWSRGITAVAAFRDGMSMAFLLDAGLVGEDGQPVDQREVVVLDTTSGELRWNIPVASVNAGLAHLDDLTVVVDGAEMHAYDAGGQSAWTAPTPIGDDAPDEPEPVSLVAHDGHLFAMGRDVFEIDAATGDSALVIDSGTTRDVVAAGDHVIVAGVFAVAGVPLSDLPLGERQVTVVTG